MTKVGACIVLTCVAITLRIQFRKVLSKLSILYNQTSLTGHTSPVTSNSSRQDTVKHIHPTNHPINQAIWCSHTHQIAWFVFRQQLGCEVQDCIHLFVGFSHRQTTDRIAWEIHADKVMSRLATQIFKSSPLHNPKQSLVMRTTMSLQTTLSPTAGTLD